MPRLYDRRPRAVDDHNPLKNQLNYEDTDAYIRDAGDKVHNGIFSDMAQSQAGVMQQVFKIQDILDLLSGTEGGDLSDLGAAWTNHRADVRATIDSLVQSLFGWVGTGWSNEDSAQALADQAATTASLSAAVQALQNNYNNAAVGGVSAFVDFTLRSDASSLGADFTQTYSGTGTGLLGISDGKATWLPVNDSARSCVAVYNALETTTDYQMVGGAFASAPNFFNNTAQGRNRLTCRSNAAGTTYVYADFGKNDVELGCVVAGVKTVFATKTSGFSFKANSMYRIIPGTTAGIRVFQVLDGTTPILSHTEVGTTSQLGVGYRSGGIYDSAYATALGTSSPGRLLAFALSDNYPTVVVTSGAIMYRTNTTDVNLATGTNVLPASYFDNLGPHSDDITSDLALGRHTVSVASHYHIEASVCLDGIVPNNLRLAVFKNGVLERKIGTPAGGFSGLQHTGGGDTYHDRDDPIAITGSYDIDLGVNDYVEIGTVSPSSATSLLSADSGGTETFFSITRTGSKGVGG